MSKVTLALQKPVLPKEPPDCPAQVQNRRFSTIVAFGFRSLLLVVLSSVVVWLRSLVYVVVVLFCELESEKWLQLRTYLIALTLS